MKKFALLTIISALATVAVRADEQRLPISFSGTVQTGAKTKVKITEADLVTAVGNRLVMAINLSSNTVVIEEWDAALSNQVDRATDRLGTQALLGTFRMAVFISGTKATFETNLESDDFDWDDDTLRDTEAELHASGKASLSTNGAVTKVSAKVIGVMNDAQGDHEGNASTDTMVSPTLGPLWSGNATFKGKIKSVGDPF